MRAFVLRAEFGKYTDVFKDHNYIGVGLGDSPAVVAGENGTELVKQSILSNSVDRYLILLKSFHVLI